MINSKLLPDVSHETLPLLYELDTGDIVFATLHNERPIYFVMVPKKYKRGTILPYSISELMTKVTHTQIVITNDHFDVRRYCPNYLTHVEEYVIFFGNLALVVISDSNDVGKVFRHYSSPHYVKTTKTIVIENL